MCVVDDHIRFALVGNFSTQIRNYDHKLVARSNDKHVGNQVCHRLYHWDTINEPAFRAFLLNFN